MQIEIPEPYNINGRLFFRKGDVQDALYKCGPMAHVPRPRAPDDDDIISAAEGCRLWGNKSRMWLWRGLKRSREARQAAAGKAA